MSTLLSIGNEKSADLIVLFTCGEVTDQLFLAALEWGDERSKLTHYVRRSRFERVPRVPTAYLSDPARLMTITFYYESQPLEKAAELATDLYDEVTQSLIIVENVKIRIWENMQSLIPWHFFPHFLIVIGAPLFACRLMRTWRWYPHCLLTMFLYIMRMEL